MMARSGLLVYALSLVLGHCVVGQPVTMRSPEQTARPIVERIMRETSFAFRTVPQKPVLAIEVVDFGSVFGERKHGFAFASSNISVSNDTTVAFGLSHGCPLTIRLNNVVVYSDRDTSQFYFEEIGYEIFRFNDVIRLPLKKGSNNILIKANLREGRKVCYLREMTIPGAKASCRFSSPGGDRQTTGDPWRYLGTFKSDPGIIAADFPQEAKKSGSQYGYNGKDYKWRLPETRQLKELSIVPGAAYRRESYVEWQYATGVLMLSLLDFADASHDKVTAGFVKTYCSFTLDNLALFRKQYQESHAFRSTGHRLIRRSMLDDTGAPTLPFAELLIRTKDTSFKPLVYEMAEYVSDKQLRLSDGTFCRNEPTPGTVWADDLFMSAPLLVRMEVLTGDTLYFDDAVKQVTKFNKYLRDDHTGLYRHGWYDLTRCQSPIAWGRANGWIIWATSEVLEHLPASHPLRKTVTKIFRRQLAAVVNYQGPSGLWHQVLDRSDSFEETSCTAMFIIAIARGLRLGILDESYREPLQKAWMGLQSRISADGIVRDISRGTGLSDDYNFYAHRERFDNDPRGLGAVIMACTEMMQFQDKKDKSQ